MTQQIENPVSEINQDKIFFKSSTKELTEANLKEELKKDNSTEEELKKELKKLMYEKIKGELEQAILTENLIIFTGAGSSIIGDKGGKSMEGLWSLCEGKVEGQNNEDLIAEAIELLFGKETQEAEAIKLLFGEETQENDASKKLKEEKNLENLLSRLQIEKQARSNRGDDVKGVGDVIEAIQKIIKDACSFEISSEFPHGNFLRKLIKARKKTSSRLKIFTLNYDTCFEQAANEIGAVIIDGFSFSQGGKFRSTDFDLDIVQREKSRIHKEENFYEKVFHLYKLHGSVSWEQSGADIFKKEKTGNPLLIYPNSSKFEESYQMPFFEMISRFQMAVREPNTALIIIGYSFGDEHINRIIKEALQTNFNLKILVIDREIEIKKDDKKSMRKELFDLIRKGLNNLAMIGDDFANFTKNLPDVSFDDSVEIREKIFEEIFKKKI